MEQAGSVNSSLLKRLWRRIEEDDLPGLSAQLAYFFLLSLFPLLIFLFTLIPYLQIPNEAILGFIRGFAPVEALDLIERNLHDIMNHRHGGLLSFGIIGTVWSASNGINAVVNAFNKAYNVKKKRSLIASSLMGVLLTIGMIFIFVVAAALPIFGKEIGLYFSKQFGFTEQFLAIWELTRLLVSAIILFLIFTGLYWIAPNVKLRCRSAFPGAAFSTVGWILASVILSIYVRNFNNFSLTYGSIGAIIVLMLWLYISGFIVILGGEINAFYSANKKSGC